MNRNVMGFTLAEVLITLGVIGVVAAITMPTLIQDYKAAQRTAQLKKTISTINQAYQRVIEEYGSADTWGLNDTNTKTEDENGKPIYDRSGGVLIAQRLVSYMSNAKIGNNSILISDEVSSIDGRTAFKPLKLSDDNVYIQMSDGAIFYLGWITNCTKFNAKCADIWIVYPKKHTTIGVDVFNFNFNSAKGIVPYTGMKGNLKASYNECSKFTEISTPDINGRGCSDWIWIIGNMDYLKCDDLNWETKHKCK